MYDYKVLRFPLTFIFKIDEILSKHYSKQLKREKFYLIIELIQRRSQQFPGIKTHLQKARLKSEYLQSHIGRDYKKYFDILIDENILKTDNRYIVGEKCKDFWIDYKILNAVKMEDLFIDGSVEISDIVYRKIRKNLVAPEKGHLAYQFNLLMSDKFYFDFDEAESWLITQVRNGLRCDSPKYNCYKRMMFDLQDKYIITVEDEKTGRIFTNFNLCKRELRSFCYFRDLKTGVLSKLKSLDLKSSQPFLLASQLLKENPDSTDCLNFYKTVVEDDIYNYFLKRFIELNGSTTYKNYDGTICSIESRQDVKPEFLKVLFKGNAGFAALEKVFKEDFPEVFAFIKAKKDKGESNALAIELQFIEASIFLEAHRRIVKLGMDCLTVHDSLYFKDSNYDKVKSILTEVFIERGYSGFILS